MTTTTTMTQNDYLIRRLRTSSARRRDLSLMLDKLVAGLEDGGSRLTQTQKCNSVILSFLPWRTITADRARNAVRILGLESLIS